MGLHWGLEHNPYDWQNDPEYAEPTPDILGAADDRRKADKENAEPADDPILRLTVVTLDLTRKAMETDGAE